MKKLFLTFAFTVLLTPTVYAGEVVKIGVNGMVCDFCAQAIEKVFMKQDAVEGIDVNLTDKMITVDMKDGKTMGDEAITTLVNDSGYALVDITREEVSDE